MNRVVISGLPGAGKTTLAQHLHRLTGWPVFSLDAEKEMLAIEREAADLPLPDQPQGWDLLAADALVSLLPESGPCIVDAFLADPAVRARVRPRVADAVEVFCRCGWETAWSRFEKRAPDRRYPHVDHLIAREQYMSDLTALRADEPLRCFGPVVEVDMDSGPDVQADGIAQRLAGLLLPRPREGMLHEVPVLRP